MSSSEAGDDLPGRREGFRPRASLRRTPPTTTGRLSDGSRTQRSLLSPEETAAIIADAVTKAVASMSPPTVELVPPSGPSKRLLSPDMYTETARPKRRTATRIGSTAAAGGSDYGTPITTSEEDEELLAKSLARAPARVLLSRASAAAANISGVACGPTSKLYKADVASINASLTKLMEIVGHLGMQVEADRGALQTQRSKQEAAEVACARERERVAAAERAAATRINQNSITSIQ